MTWGEAVTVPEAMRPEGDEDWGGEDGGNEEDDGGGEVNATGSAWLAELRERRSKKTMAMSSMSTRGRSVPHAPAHLSRAHTCNLYTDLLTTCTWCPLAPHVYNCPATYWQQHLQNLSPS